MKAATVPAMIVGLAVAPVLGATEAAPVSRPALKLASCSGAGIPDGARCGTLTVFENRSTRTGRTIDLNFVLLPAKTGNEPVFLLAGGPGGAATTLAGFLPMFVGGAERSHDIVLVDQRGTGRSNPLACTPTSPAELLDVYLEGALPRERLLACRQRADADLTLYTTPIAMDDLDDVREALGYERIHLWGGSYGTRAALVYLRRHPDRVASVTLRAAVPTYEKVPLYFAKDAQKALDAVLDDCAADEACHAAYPASRRHLDAVLERLSAEPVQTVLPEGDAEVEITRTKFAAGLLFLLYDSATAGGIPAVIDSAHDGDFAPLIEAVTPFLRRMQGQISFGMFLSVICAEDAAFISEDEIRRETRGTFLGPAFVENIVELCRDWPTGKLPEGYREPVHSDVPVLIFSGEVDPTAAPRMAEEIASHLPNSRHVILPGVGHVPTMPGCTGEIFAEFVNGTALEDLDVRCAVSPGRPAFPARREADKDE